VFKYGWWVGVFRYGWWVDVFRYGWWVDVFRYGWWVGVFRYGWWVGGCGWVRVRRAECSENHRAAARLMFYLGPDMGGRCEQAILFSKRLIAQTPARTRAANDEQLASR